VQKYTYHRLLVFNPYEYYLPFGIETFRYNPRDLPAVLPSVGQLGRDCVVWEIRIVTFFLF
jgi:hypothetical protein